MEIKKVNAFYFSATGGTEAVVNAFLRDIEQAEKICLNRNSEQILVKQNELAVFAVPVYEGRVSPAIAERIRRISGNGGPAVALVVYGNRDYEDALVELSDIVTEGGFVVTAAAAFVAEHNTYSKLAAGRPDVNDRDCAAKFAESAIKMAATGQRERVAVPGNRPYRAMPKLDILPDCTDDCTACGVCVEKCPQQAIAIESPRETDPDSCIQCQACIKHCPTGARRIPVEYKKNNIEPFLEQFTKIRREPELFL